MTRRPRHRASLAGRLPRRHRPGRHRRPPRRTGRYAAAGFLALTGHVTAMTGAAAGIAAATPALPRPAKPRHVTRSAPVRAATTRWVTRTVPGAVYRGRATWYGPGFAGHRTANGETFDPLTDLTAAHRWLPFGTLLRVCRGERCVVVRVNDRGPFGNAMLDLSYAAAVRLGMVRAGIDDVTATVLTPRRIELPA